MLSVWSRGMIPASGAGGPEFESRNGPGDSFALDALQSTFNNLEGIQYIHIYC